MSNYRHGVRPDGVPVQQSMTVNPRDYASTNLTSMMLGVVIDVQTADDSRNRTAQSVADRRGFLHTCTVLVTRDGGGSGTLLNNVVITPDSASGINNYEEKLPRPATALTTGADLPASYQNIDPYELDGDWCIVGFIGGIIYNPFIVRWWPHGRNPFDPSTHGLGNPDSSGNGTALDQTGRYLKRVNGVEQVINKNGDIFISTKYAGSTVTMGQDPTLGRFNRAEKDVGGSIRLNVKPNQSLELNWNEQEDGIGVLDAPEPALPQTNPQPTDPASDSNRDNTYVLFNKEDIDIIVPNQLVVTAGSVVELEAPEVKLGTDADQAVVRGDDYADAEATFVDAVDTYQQQVLAAFGAMNPNPAVLATPVTAADISAGTALVAAAGVALTAAIAQFKLASTTYLSTKVKTE